MRLSVPLEELVRIVSNQLSFVSPNQDIEHVTRAVDLALQRVEHCFSYIALRSYSCSSGPYFNHLHGDQSAAFLYFASHVAWRTLENVELASALFLVNKMRNSIVVMYDTELPAIFLLNHTVGTVLGKATYGNFFVAYQNVTVGTDRGIQPTIGERVVLYSGSSVLGSSELGNHATVATNSVVLRTNIPDWCIASGTYPNISTIPAKSDISSRYFFASTSLRTSAGS